MKQWIIIIVALSIIILLNFWQCTYLRETGKYLLSDINAIDNFLDLENFELCKNAILELENTWKDVEPTWDTFGEHDDIEKVGESIQSMKVYAKYEKKFELENEYTLLQTRIKNVINTEKFAFKNIF